MHQATHRTNFGTRLRRAWNAVMRAAEAMDRSPMEEACERLDRLERELAVVRDGIAAGIDELNRLS
ncbi:MAG TPA: hypothetical protein VFB23_04970 [Candidatus Acidoferrales bacterium]|nr:hypothetical protein [Candidatus Acidoferrales bacterium]